MMKFEDIDIYKPYNLNFVDGHLPHDAVRPKLYSDGVMKGTADQLQPLGLRRRNTLGEEMIYVCAAESSAGKTYPALAYVDIYNSADSFNFYYTTDVELANVVVFYSFETSTFGWVKLRLGVKAVSSVLAANGPKIVLDTAVAETDSGLTGNGTTTALAFSPRSDMVDGVTIRYNATASPNKFSLYSAKVDKSAPAEGRPLQFTTASEGSSTVTQLTRRT
jgi:hypothetical protein